MLDKNNLKTGDYVIVNDIVRMGLGFHEGMNKPMKYMRLWTSKTFGIGEYIPLFPKEELKIIKMPEYVNGVMVAEIEDGDRNIGYVYWCELRASCNKIKE